MKNLLLCAALVFCSIVLHAYPVRIASWNLDRDVKTINDLRICIDSVSRSDGSIIAYVRDEAEHNLLLSAGLDAIRIPDLARDQYNLLSGANRDDGDPMHQYYSIAEFQAFMQTTAAAYPEICELQQFGSSVQNRPLYFMKISDNVSQNEAEPEVKLVGSIHGDETVGFVMLTRLIQLLTEQYATDPRIANIVNNTEIWIAPLMNPDGYANGERYNAAGVDLNRNFPMPNGVTNPDGNPTATENLAMIDFSNQHNFCIGINFHGGALVINYPWDYSHVLTPDDAMIRELSLTYSRNNSPMFNSNEFPQGITNGAAWYVITGSMQDWNYAFTSNIELTAEISTVKWPPASTLDGYWNDNRESILAFLEFAQKGIKGTVANAQGPIPATIKILQTGKNIANDTTLGDYHRVLMPGTYTVVVSAAGHIPESREVVVPTVGHSVQNFLLEPAQIMSVSGIVRDSDGFPVGNAAISLNTDPEITTVSGADGTFSIPQVLEGDYLISVTATTYATYQSQLNLRQSDPEFRIAIMLNESLFAEDFETDLEAWNVASPWARIQLDGSWVLTDSPNGNYNNNANRSIRLQNPVSLQNIDFPSLSFMAKWDLEAGYDYVYVEGSTNGSEWNQIGSFTGQQSTWINQTFALNAFTGQDFYLRFRIRSDWSQTADGIYIDDIYISGRNNISPLWGDANGDKSVDIYDISAILDHSVGILLEPESISAADVDGDSVVHALDAYQVWLYLSQPEFLFPVQNQQPFVLPETNITASHQDGILSLMLPEDLRSLDLTLPFPIEAPASGDFIHSVDANAGRLSLIFPFTHQPNTLMLSLEDHPDTFSIAAMVNGYPRTIMVVPSSNQDNASPELSFRLLQNHPNPFNPKTGISFSLPEGGDTSLKIFNLKGQLVRILHNGFMEPGNHSLVWNGKDDSGSDIGSGVYLYRLESPAGTKTRKMVLSK